MGIKKIIWYIYQYPNFTILCLLREDMSRWMVATHHKLMQHENAWKQVAVMEWSTDLAHKNESENGSLKTAFSKLISYL